MRRWFPNRWVWAGAVVAAVIGLIGCGGVKRIPTGGTVTLDGQPLKQGVLQFVPDPSKGNNLRLGCTGPVSNGHFNLVTAGMEKADTGPGAPVGWFKVTYTNPNEGDKSVDQSSVGKVATKYRREETTPISIELTDPPPADGYKVVLTSK